MNSDKATREKHTKILEDISEHLRNNYINSQELDTEFVSDLVTILTECDELNDTEFRKLFWEKGLISETDIEEYLSVAYMVGVCDKEARPARFFHIVPKKTIEYFLKCEIKASIMKDASYTIHNLGYTPLSKIERFFRKMSTLRGYNFSYLCSSAKNELGLIKKSEKKKKEKCKKPKKEKQIVPKKETKEDDDINPEWMYTEPPKKNYTPSEELKEKRRRKERKAFDPAKLEAKIKNKITSGLPEEDIVNYIQDETNTDYENSLLFLKELVFYKVKTALWTDKPASKNTINYLSNTKQKEIAEDYISKNAISETIGIQRIGASWDLLLKHLALEENIIGDIINGKLQKYTEFLERIEATQPAQESLEQTLSIGDKPIYVTKHIKQRALQRIGEGANKENFLKDMFHEGRTIVLDYDSNPHRVFQFSGEDFEMPYADNEDEIVLLTLFPRKNY